MALRKVRNSLRGKKVWNRKYFLTKFIKKIVRIELKNIFQIFFNIVIISMYIDVLIFSIF